MTRTAVSIVTACIAASLASADSTKNSSAAPDAAPTADPIHSLRLDPDERRLPLRAAPRAHRAADQFDIFDGFETYHLGPFDGQTANAPPGVMRVSAQNDMLIVDTIAAGVPPGLDPHGLGDSRHLMDARGDTGEFSTEVDRRWLIEFDRILAPTGAHDLIVAADFYFPDLETLHSFSPVSFDESLIVTRILQAGWYDHPLTTDTGGVLTRPAVLGIFNSNLCCLPTFYAPPLDTGTDGALAPLTTPVGEWFTIAFHMNSDSLSVWMRSSDTDGQNGVVIEVPDAPTLFESGWTQVYPGLTAEQMAPGVWTGHGEILDSGGRTLHETYPTYPAARSVDAVMSTWFPGTAVPDDPEWAPTNRHVNNISVITAPLPCPADLTGSGAVGSDDLSKLLSCWGSEWLICRRMDFTGSGVVGAADLAFLLSSWGPCPE